MDALVFSHILYHLKVPFVSVSSYLLITSNSNLFFLFHNQKVSPVRDVIEKHQNLVEYCNRIYKDSFKSKVQREIPPFTRVPLKSKGEISVLSLLSNETDLCLRTR